jgi:hypothetical protein
MTEQEVEDKRLLADMIEEMGGRVTEGRGCGGGLR